MTIVKYGLLLFVVISICVWRTESMTVAALTNYGMAYSNRASISEERAKEYAVKAESILRRAANLTPLDRSLWQHIALLLLLQQREQEALVIWENIPGSDAELLQRGHHARLQNKFAEAIYWYELAAQLKSAHRDPWYFLGLAYSSMSRSEEALFYYHRALAITRLDSDQISNAELYCELGWQYHWLLEPRDPHKAIYYYNLALANSLITENIDCRFKRAELLFWYFNEPEKAAQDYAVISKLQPANVQVLANLVFARYQQSGEFTTAEKELLQLVQFYPQSKWGYWRLGDVYRMVRQYENAIQIYGKALELDPANPQLPLIIDDLTSKNG